MATIKDIAKITGVSAMTVSRAFNNPERVKEDLRNQILSVARDLNYVPNQAARSLVGSRTGIVQIVTSMRPEDLYFTQLFTGAAHRLSEEGFSIMINRHKAHDYQYDGAIFMGLKEGEDKHIYETIKKPYVLFGKSSYPIDWVDVDNTEGTWQVTRHLIEMGHTRIGFVGLNLDEGYVKERYVGYCKAMDQAGLIINEEATFTVDHGVPAIMAAAEDILAVEDITAFVCETDVQAYGLIEAAKARGMDLPKDLSVVGFDGFLFNQMASPRITTVKQPIYKIGVEIADLLLKRMKKPDKADEHRLIKTEFEPGESVYRI